MVKLNYLKTHMEESRNLYCDLKKIHLEEKVAGDNGIEEMMICTQNYLIIK